MIPVTLAFSGDQNSHLRDFLFPGDGNEAVAILLCGRRDGDRRHRLTVREVHGIPYDKCTVRTPRKVSWPTDVIVPILERAANEHLSVVKVHSHPSGYPTFSEIDDESDQLLLPMVKGWIEEEIFHGSAVMLPDGSMFGRVLGPDGTMKNISTISVAGDDIHIWSPETEHSEVPEFAASHSQAFDEGTIRQMQKMSFAVVGASGTGSPTVEQLVRLGAGEIVIVDDDTAEVRNINRILNSSLEDARTNRPKVDILADAAEKVGLGTRVIRIAKSLWDPDVIRSVAQCDVVFGCMDTIDGRYLLNRLATQYLIPYFDVGVRLDAGRNGAEKGRITEACGTIHYLQPGRSSLISRDLFTMAEVSEAALQRQDPSAHDRQIKDGYIRGFIGHRPAVISVNMLGSSLAVNEFLARLHAYREDPNACHAAVTFSLASVELFSEPETGICEILAPFVGHGDAEPMLGQFEFCVKQTL